MVFFALQTLELVSGGTIDVGEARSLVDQLVVITEPTQTSIFPQDLNTANFVLTTAIDSLIMDLGGNDTADVLDVSLMFRQQQTVCLQRNIDSFRVYHLINFQTAISMMLIN